MSNFGGTMYSFFVYSGLLQNLTEKSRTAVMFARAFGIFSCFCFPTAAAAAAAANVLRTAGRSCSVFYIFF